MRHRLIGGIALAALCANGAASQNLGEQLGRRLGDAIRQRLGGALGVPGGGRSAGRPVRGAPGMARSSWGGDDPRFHKADETPDDGSLIGADGTIALDQADEAKRRIDRLTEAEQQRFNDCAQKVWAEFRATGRQTWGGSSMPEKEKAACRAEADLGTSALRKAIVAGAARRVAATPATIEGLQSLTKLQDNYESAYAGRLGRGSNDTRLVWQDIAPIIEQKRIAIETPLRPQIIARMNGKDGGPAFIESLFGYSDKGRAATYALLYEDRDFAATIPKRPGNERLFFERTTDIARSNRERTQAAGFATWTEPTSNEMALALMRVAINTGGRQVSPSIVSVPSALDRMGMDVFSGSMKMYSKFYEVRKAACRREAPGYRCSYRTWIKVIDGAGGSGGFGGALAASMVNGTEVAGRLFIPTRYGWYAPENEAMVTQMQTAQIQQLSDTVSRVADAGTNAMSVLTNAQGGSSREPGEDSQAEQERKQRVEDAERRNR